VRILEKLGYRDIIRANDGEEAVSLVLDNPVNAPQLVLMDMQMPV
jgi:CheY-like chemotaxis protein